MDITKQLDRIELLSKEFFRIEREIAALKSHLSALYESKICEMAESSYGESHLTAAAFYALRSDDDNNRLEKELDALKSQYQEVSIQLERARYEVLNAIASKVEFLSMVPAIANIGTIKH